MVDVFHDLFPDETPEADSTGGGKLSDADTRRIKVEQIRRSKEWAANRHKTKPTVYAMVPTGRSLQIGVSNPLVTSWVNEELRPVMVDVATGVVAQTGRMMPHERAQAMTALDKFGDALDASVALLHQGQSGNAVNAANAAVNEMLTVTSALSMRDATNALLDMNPVIMAAHRIGTRMAIS